MCTRMGILGERQAASGPQCIVCQSITALRRPLRAMQRAEGRRRPVTARRGPLPTPRPTRLDRPLPAAGGSGAVPRAGRPADASARARSTAARRGCWRWCWRWWLACTSSSSACSLAPPTRAGSTLRTRRCRATAGSARAAPYPASAATSSPRGTSSCSPASPSPPPSSCSACPPWGTATGADTSASRASS